MIEGSWRRDPPTESWHSLSLNKASDATHGQKQSGRNLIIIFTTRDVYRGSGVVRDLMSKGNQDKRKQKGEYWTKRETDFFVLCYKLLKSLYVRKYIT